MFLCRLLPLTRSPICSSPLVLTLRGVCGHPPRNRTQSCSWPVCTLLFQLIALLAAHPFSCILCLCACFLLLWKLNFRTKVLVVYRTNISLLKTDVNPHRQGVAIKWIAPASKPQQPRASHIKTPMQSRHRSQAPMC